MTIKDSVYLYRTWRDIARVLNDQLDSGIYDSRVVDELRMVAACYKVLADELASVVEAGAS